MIKESEETGETRMIYAKAGKAELEKEKQALDARYASVLGYVQRKAGRSAVGAE